MDNETNEMSPSEVLKHASQKAGKKNLITFDPMEKIPTLAIGDDVKEGQVICGIFTETQRLVSQKFTMSQEKDPETGAGVQYRHVLTNNGVKFAIWNCGELKLIFSKLTPGQYIELTYKGKGQVNGRPQHQFESKIEKPILNS